MNNNGVNSSNNFKKFLVFGLILLIGASIITTVYIVRQRTNPRSKAAASTTLAFDPSTQNVGVGQAATADLTLDPGNNQVSLIKLIISYDGSKFDSTHTKITPILLDPSAGANAQGFVQILQPFANDCTGTICKMSITLSIGSSPTNVITQALKVGTVSLMPIAPTDFSGTTVAVDQSTQILSLGAADQPSENVLQISSLTPLLVTINSGSVTPTPPVCIPNQSTCSWDAVADVVNYHYIVTDVNTGGVIQESDVDSSQTSIQFPSQSGKTYKCSVTATNSCKATSTAGQATQTCTVPTPTSCPTPGTVKNLKLICPNCIGANQ